LEDNPATNLTLEEKIDAFNQYRAKWNAFAPATWQKNIHNFPSEDHVGGSGVCGFITEGRESIQFFALGLVSPGISPKEWGFQPGFLLETFAINPHANALALVERKES
jgi:hypothetical protein